MKALSLHPHWAAFIEAGLKSVELRSRPTSFRGTLLICASKRQVKGWRGLPHGCAICIVEVIGCHRMKPEDEARSGVAFDPTLWSWEIANVRPVENVPVTGRLGFFDVPDELIAKRRAV